MGLLDNEASQQVSKIVVKIASNNELLVESLIRELICGCSPRTNKPPHFSTQLPATAGPIVFTHSLSMPPARCVCGGLKEECKQAYSVCCMPQFCFFNTQIKHVYQYECPI